MNAANAYAQFTGSIALGGYHSTNIEGRDSATPDNVPNPSIDLQYNWSISKPAAIKFEAMLTPNFFEEVKARSYVKSFLGITGNFYLSSIDEDRKFTPVILKPAIESIPQEKNISKYASDHPVVDTTKPAIIITPAAKDVPQTASLRLSEISELLDSFEIDKSGLSTDSITTSSDLKDSVSESVLALSEILSSQIFTESLADVVTAELGNQKKTFDQVPMKEFFKNEVALKLEDVLTLLKGTRAQSDILPMPKATIESQTPISPVPPTPKDELIAEALAHLVAENIVSEKKAPIITLVNSQTRFNELGSSDILIKDDILPFTTKTVATFLSVPVSLETQNNKDAYKIYSYSIFEFKPRLDLYFGENVGIGITYDLSRTVFPNDTSHVNDGTEHLVRLDSRIALSSAVAMVAEAGISARGYDHPIQYLIQITPKRTAAISTASRYSHYFLGGALALFPFEKLSIGLAVHITRSSSLRPYLSDLIGARSKISGNANIDEYSYDLTRETVFSLWRIFADIDFALDLSYESRQYANIQIPKRLLSIVQQSSIDRVDHGPQFAIGLSREFLFDSRLISIFTSFTPAINIQSTSFTSTLSQFSYKDVTTSLSFEFGF